MSTSPITRDTRAGVRRDAVEELLRRCGKQVEKAQVGRFRQGRLSITRGPGVLHPASNGEGGANAPPSGVAGSFEDYVQTCVGSALTVRMPPGPFFQANQLPFCETMQ